MSKDNIDQIVLYFKEKKFTARAPEPIENLSDEKKRNEWIHDKNAIVFTVNDQNSLLQVDIFLTYPIEYSELKKNSDLFEIDGVKFHVSSKSDLVKAKRLVNPMRDKDLEDIKSLETLLEQKEN